MSVGGPGETVRNDYYDESVEQSEKAREEARVLYVAMTRAIRSFSWIAIEGKQKIQNVHTSSFCAIQKISPPTSPIGREQRTPIPILPHPPVFFKRIPRLFYKTSAGSLLFRATKAKVLQSDASLFVQIAFFEKGRKTD